MIFKSDYFGSALNEIDSSQNLFITKFRLSLLIVFQERKLNELRVNNSFFVATSS